MNRSNAGCYRMLGLQGTESIDQIRRAYRQLARRLHPDRVGGDSAKFKEITAAYNQLVTLVSSRAALRASAAHSPRGTRRRNQNTNRRSEAASQRSPSGDAKTRQPRAGTGHAPRDAGYQA